MSFYRYPWRLRPQTLDSSATDPVRPTHMEVKEKEILAFAPEHNLIVFTVGFITCCNEERHTYGREQALLAMSEHI